jgi:dTDP-glucose 4,6-dehydratase
MMEALKQTAAWYDQHREWWQADKEAVEAQYAKQGQ